MKYILNLFYISPGFACKKLKNTRNVGHLSNPLHFTQQQYTFLSKFDDTQLCDFNFFLRICQFFKLNF